MPDSRNKKRTLHLFAAGLLTLLLAFALIRIQKQDATTPLRVTSVLMGTTWHIIADPVDDSSTHLDEAMQKAFAEVRRIESMMSEWQPDSDLSRLNRAAGSRPVTLPAEFVALLSDAVRLGQLTAGAFDVTWLPLKPLWPFANPFTPPTKSAVSEAVSLVNYQNIVFKDNTAFLPVTGMAIGLGGIAKGYAIDRAAAVLSQAGIQRFLVDGGGDILVAAPLDTPPWKIGIRDPDAGQTSFMALLQLRNGAVATSGNYEHYIDFEGHRYSHILNPRTGYPSEGTRQVTVLATDAKTADALATGFFVLPLARATALARQLELGTVIISDDNQRTVTGIEPEVITWVGE